FYSMVRSVTTEMVYAMMACVVAGTAFAVIKSKMAGLFKGILVLVAVGVLAVMLSTDAKFWGVLTMGCAVIILFFLPWLDQSPAKSIRYRPGWHKYVYAVFIVDFFVLGFIGTKPPSPTLNLITQTGTFYYFGFFLLMPWWSRLGEFKPVPDRVTYAAH
ncbi:MAG: cytochrome bc complex cytochrome b subunit, partial [Rhodoferax sp.]